MKKPTLKEAVKTIVAWTDTNIKEYCEDFTELDEEVLSSAVYAELEGNGKTATRPGGITQKTARELLAASKILKQAANYAQEYLEANPDEYSYTRARKLTAAREKMEAAITKAEKEAGLWKRKS